MVVKSWCWRRLLRVSWTVRRSVNPKENQWIFTGRKDAEAETPILWPPNVKNWLIGKDPDIWKDWRQEEKGMTEMIGWHHRLDGDEFEQALGVGNGQGSLACCSPWGHKQSDTTEWLNWTETCFPSGIKYRRSRDRLHVRNQYLTNHLSFWLQNVAWKDNQHSSKWPGLLLFMRLDISPQFAKYRISWQLKFKLFLWKCGYA